MTQPGSALAARVQSGEAQSFESFYTRHRSVAFGVAMHILNDHGLADDAMQEAFLGFWRNRDRYRPEPSAGRALLLTIVRNRAIDSWRREHLRRGEPDDEARLALVCAADDTASQVILSDEIRNVRRTLEQLPSEQRSVIELGYFEGLTHAEIAATLRVPLGTAKGRMRLGLDKLRASADSD
jgi:RNA polymerase sigma-70 factor (ECF subfamily)